MWAAAPKFGKWVLAPAAIAYGAKLVHASTIASLPDGLHGVIPFVAELASTAALVGVGAFFAEEIVRISAIPR